jgi:hypothetical protein
MHELGMIVVPTCYCLMMPEHFDELRPEKAQHLDARTGMDVSFVLS